ncbi:MAG: hypothetical protein Q7N95_14295 [Alphaproteobacteria bacterium]|nr:hypothetical protein [Alphaproteobacteria bacterium]
MNHLYKLAFAISVIFPAIVHAHPGDHSGVADMVAVVVHMFTQPDHLLLIGAALAGIYLFRKSRRPKGQDTGSKEF